MDLAYQGVRRDAPQVDAAMQTRGVILVYQGLPVPALFSACSGGCTESASYSRPDLRGADGRRSMTAVMPSVEDPSARTGALALSMDPRISTGTSPLPSTRCSAACRSGICCTPIRRRSATWMGVRIRIRIRVPDSGRVATMLIHQFLADHEMGSPMSAAEIGLAVGPGLIRSTF